MEGNRAAGNSGTCVIGMQGSLCCNEQKIKQGSLNHGLRVNFKQGFVMLWANIFECVKTILKLEKVALGKENSEIL